MSLLAVTLDSVRLLANPVQETVIKQIAIKLIVPSAQLSQIVRQVRRALIKCVQEHLVKQQCVRVVLGFVLHLAPKLLVQVLTVLKRSVLYALRRLILSHANNLLLAKF